MRFLRGGKEDSSCALKLCTCRSKDILEQSEGLMFDQDGSQAQLHFKITWGACKKTPMAGVPPDQLNLNFGWDVGRGIFL